MTMFVWLLSYVRRIFCLTHIPPWLDISWRLMITFLQQPLANLLKQIMRFSKETLPWEEEIVCFVVT